MLINILYPKTCGICNRIGKNEVCPKCNRKLKKLNQFSFEKCNGEYYQELAYLFKYEGIIRKKLIDYKFYELGYLYKTFSYFFLKNKKILDFIKKYDIIIPIPIHNKRKKQRGYNQTELIARKICKEVGIELAIDVIKKTVNTKPQSTLNQEKRKSNSKNVYSLYKQEKIKDKNILIFDDIFTTGSTVSEFSRILSLAKPKSIGVMIIAKD